MSLYDSIIARRKQNSLMTKEDKRLTQTIDEIIYILETQTNECELAYYFTYDDTNKMLINFNTLRTDKIISKENAEQITKTITNWLHNRYGPQFSFEIVGRYYDERYIESSFTNYEHNNKYYIVLTEDQ